MTPEELFLSELPLIRRMIAFTCRRYACPAEEAEEFAAWAQLRLVEDSYAALRKFEGRSKLSTYLSVVIQRLFLDFRVERWGKWRPSAEARRLGPLAVRLESLLERDGLSFEEACQVLGADRADGPARGEIEGLAGRLPVRPRRRFVGEESLVETAGGERPDEALLRGEEEAAKHRAEALLAEALRALAPEDRLIVKLRFFENLNIADIATTLGVEAKPLYRRVERLLADLRRTLGTAGVRAEDLGLAAARGALRGERVGIAERRPSNLPAER